MWSGGPLLLLPFPALGAAFGIVSEDALLLEVTDDWASSSHALAGCKSRALHVASQVPAGPRLPRGPLNGVQKPGHKTSRRSLPLSSAA